MSSNILSSISVAAAFTKQYAGDTACIYTRFKQYGATGKIVSARGFEDKSPNKLMFRRNSFPERRGLSKMPAGSEFAAVSAAFVTAAVAAVSAQGQMALTLRPEQCLWRGKK